MSAISGIYDSAPIQPIARIKENLSIWTTGNWQHYNVIYSEPIPAGPASLVDMLAQTNVTTLAANTAVAKSIVTILQLNEFEFLHVRFEPLDNIEVLVWEQAGQQKLASRNIHAIVNRNSRNYDPYMALSTFFIIGQNRDMNLEIRNNMAYAIPSARVQFWGNRFVLDLIDTSQLPAAEKTKLRAGDISAVRQHIGPTTWIPAEGRQA